MIYPQSDFSRTPKSVSKRVAQEPPFARCLVAIGRARTLCEVDLDLQALLAKQFQGTWMPGYFEDSFHDLDELSKGFDDLTLAQTEVILRAAQKASPEPVQAFGLKLPAATAVVWGPVLILCAQFYMMIYLYEPRRARYPDNSEDAVEWIGLYKSWWASLSVSLSVGLLPIITVLTIGYEGWVNLDLQSQVHIWRFQGSFSGPQPVLSYRKRAAL
jgi:hypothetical protein